MRMFRLPLSIVTAGFLAIVTAPASAQIITFTYRGTFSGGSGGTSCVTNSCTSGNFTLRFGINPLPTSYLSPSLVDLGVFLVGGEGDVFPLTTFSGVNFTLTINQTEPRIGSGSVSGEISGAVAFNPTSGSLVWMPSTRSILIGQGAGGCGGQEACRYLLVVDNTGGITISPPGVPAALDHVKAYAAIVPEPATGVLVASGLVMVGFVARRRARTRSR